MGVQQLDRAGAAGRLRDPAAAGHRRIGRKLIGRLARQVPDQRTADRKAGEQDALEVELIRKRSLEGLCLSV